MDRIKKIIIKYKKIILFLLSCFVLCSVSIVYDAPTNSITFNSNTYNIFTILILCGIYILLYRTSLEYKESNIRLFVCSSILAIIFSIFYVLGDLANTYYNAELPIISKKLILYLILQFLSYSIIFFGVISIINKLIYKKVNETNKKETIVKKYFQANKTSILVVSLIVFIVFIFYFLHFYPGILQYDAIDSLNIITGKTNLSNHHPVLWTLLLGAFFEIGYNIFNNGNIGIAMYTIFQMIIVAFTISYTIYYMAKHKLDIKWRILTLLFFILNPIICIQAVRVEKSVLFAAFTILASLQIIELTLNTKEFFKSKKNIILFIIYTLLMCLLRNNGIYAIVLTFIIIAIIKRKYIGKICLVFLVPIIVYFIIQGPIFTLCKVVPGEFKEALSIPIQQFARVAKYEGSNLSTEEKEKIERYCNMTIDEIAEQYKPTVSDPIKSNFIEEYALNDKMGIIKLYCHFLVKYPKITLESLLFNTFGYYYPNSIEVSGLGDYKKDSMWALNQRIVDNEWYEMMQLKNNIDDDKTYSEKFKIQNKSILENPIIDFLNRHINQKDIPVFSILVTGIGIYFWILLFIMMYLIYSKEYEKLLGTLVSFFIWATSFAGPIVELRYVLSLIMFTPIIISLPFFKTIKQDKEYVDKKSNN